MYLRNFLITYNATGSIFPISEFFLVKKNTKLNASKFYMFKVAFFQSAQTLRLGGVPIYH